MFSLEKGSKKHICPACNKKTWVRYVDTERGNEYIPEQYGRCDRESNCHHSLNPYDDRYLFQSDKRFSPSKVWKPPRFKAPVFIPDEVLERTFSPDGYQMNTFLQNLGERVPFPFEAVDIERVINQYCLGTITQGTRAGAITFPFIDINSKIRTVQVKQFDNENHTIGTDFLHSMLKNDLAKSKKPFPLWLDSYLENDSYVTCLFGEHLLNDYPLNPVALVEAPKTAVYGTLYFGSPEVSENLLWLAVYNLSSLNVAKCRALKGREVFLFPDLSKDGAAFRLWAGKAETLSSQIQGSSFYVSDLLEQNATDEERLKGMDFADYLIRHDWREYQPDQGKQKNHISEAAFNVPTFQAEVSPEGVKGAKVSMKTNLGKIALEVEPSNDQWEIEISDLEAFFKWKPLPRSVSLNIHTRIFDVELFVLASLVAIRANAGRKAYFPYLARLALLKSVLSREPPN